MMTDDVGAMDEAPALYQLLDSVTVDVIVIQ